MSRRSRFGTGALLWRQFVAELGASATVAAIVLLTVFIATAAPRAIDSMYSESLRFASSAGGPEQRDLTADSYGGPVIAPGTDESMAPDAAEQWGGQAAQLRALYAEFPPAMAETFASPQVVVAVDPVDVRTPAEAAGSPDVAIAMGFDPLWLEHIRVSTGELPAPLEAIIQQDTVIEIVLSEAAAERTEWPVGQQREASTRPGSTQQFLLTGTFEAIDPASPYWDHMPATLRPTVIDNGNSAPTVQAVAYLDPASWKQTNGMSPAARSHFWFPFRAEKLDMGNAEQLATELRGYTAVAHTIGNIMFSAMPAASSLELGTPVINTIESSLREASATSAVLAMAASGPIGVLAAVLMLGARLIVERRRAGLSLAMARGASGRQLRLLMAAEGLIIGVPVMVLGIVAGLLLTRDSGDAGGPATLALPVLIGLAPAAVLALLSAPERLGTGRTDLGTGLGSRARWILEVVVLTLAALSVFLLLRRGLTTTASHTGVDPLLAATPLLLSLAACVVVMRLYPVPLAAFQRVAARGPGLTAFLGSARALRDPVAGLAPVLALVVGISIAVFLSIVLSTVREGVADAALGSVGADMSVSAPSLSAEQIERMRAIEGVEGATGIAAQSSANVRIGGKSRIAALLVFDQAELAAVQEGVPGALPIAPELADPAASAVLISENLSDGSEQDAPAAGDAAQEDPVELGSTPVTVVGIGDSRNAFGVRLDWIGIDRALAHELYGTKVFVTRVVLVDVDNGATSAQRATIESELASIAGDGAVLRTAAAEAAIATQNPTVLGMQIALLIAVVLAGLLCGVGVILTVVLGRPARDRLLVLLRTLGLGGAQARRLAIWELAPISVVALLVGSVLGALLPLVVLAGVDLRPFTGARVQPAASVDPLLLLLVTVGFVVVVAGATVAALLVSRNVNLARMLRTAEEG